MTRRRFWPGAAFEQGNRPEVDFPKEEGRRMKDEPRVLNGGLVGLKGPGSIYRLRDAVMTNDANEPIGGVPSPCVRECRKGPGSIFKNSSLVPLIFAIGTR
jgi:hypothetical protein